VKSQIYAGGRGLGTFTNGLKGGVHICTVNKVQGAALAAAAAAAIATAIAVTTAAGFLHEATRLASNKFETAATTPTSSLLLPRYICPGPKQTACTWLPGGKQCQCALLQPPYSSTGSQIHPFPHQEVLPYTPAAVAPPLDVSLTC